MRSALRKRDIPCEWLYKSKETHGFYKEENVAELYTKVDDFLRASIGPGATGASSVQVGAAAAH
jgi:hypothetical protein